MSSLIIGGVASISAVILGVRLYNVYFSWGSYADMLSESPEQKGSKSNVANKTVIITGSNCGIGKETARELYINGSRIILANRSETESQKVINEFHKLYPNSKGQLQFKFIDLTCLKSVKRFAAEIIQEEPHLDILINNAAIFGAPVQITKDGFEINMQVNHLAPALLTILLLPKLNENKHSPITSKIIAVTSTLYRHGNVNDKLLQKIETNQLNDFQNLKKPGKVIYASTKLANLLFIRQLAKEDKLLGNVQVCLASPGFTFTRLHRYVSRSKLIALTIFTPLFAMIMKSPRQGAQTIIGCAMSDTIRSDVMYHNCKANEKHFKSGIVNDADYCEHLFNITMKTIKDYL